MTDESDMPPQVPEDFGPEIERLAKQIVRSTLEDIGLHASLGSDNRFVPSGHTKDLIDRVVLDAVKAMEDLDPLVRALALTKVETVIGVIGQLAASLILGAEELGITGLREQLKD